MGVCSDKFLVVDNIKIYSTVEQIKKPETILISSQKKRYLQLIESSA